MLSAKMKRYLIIALTDKAAGNAFAASVDAASALSASVKKRLVIAMADKPAADELAAAIVSGAALSKRCKRRILQNLLSDQALGNEFINEVQSVATNPFKL